jgi:fructan beta-fructosidase
LFDVRADIEIGNATHVGLIVRGQKIDYDVTAKTLTALGVAPLAIDGGHLRLQVLVDRTSIETFADAGRVSLTSCFLPKTSDIGIALFADGKTAKVKLVQVFELKSAWK